MSTDTFMTFPALAGTRHGLILRHPELVLDVERAEAVARLKPWHEAMIADLGYQPQQLRLAVQVHGNGVAVVDAASPVLTTGVDALVTTDADVLLGIYVADCCAIYLSDPVTGSIGLAHSGKKGSELGIVARTIETMSRVFGSRAQDIIVQLSPCIRPPAYEVDFAASIRSQCLEVGVLPENLHDCGLCTSTDLQHFYSYRVELGKTGRMLALLGRACS